MLALSLGLWRPAHMALSGPSSLGSVPGHLWSRGSGVTNLSPHCAHLPADPSCPARPEAVFSRLELAFMFSSIPHISRLPVTSPSFPNTCGVFLIMVLMFLRAVPTLSIMVQSVLIDFLQVMGHDFSIVFTSEQFCLYAGHFDLPWLGLDFVI